MKYNISHVEMKYKTHLKRMVNVIEYDILCRLFEVVVQTNSVVVSESIMRDRLYRELRSNKYIEILDFTIEKSKKLKKLIEKNAKLTMYDFICSHFLSKMFVPITDCFDVVGYKEQDFKDFLNCCDKYDYDLIIIEINNIINSAMLNEDFRIKFEIAKYTKQSVNIHADFNNKYNMSLKYFLKHVNSSCSEYKYKDKAIVKEWMTRSESRRYKKSIRINHLLTTYSEKEIKHMVNCIIKEFGYYQ